MTIQNSTQNTLSKSADWMHEQERKQLKKSTKALRNLRKGRKGVWSVGSAE